MGLRTHGAAPVSSALAALVSSAVQVLGRNTTVVTVAASTTETTLTSFTVPANTIGSNRKLRLEIDGEYLNNSGLTLATGHVIKLTFGGVVLWQDTGKLIANSSNAKPFSMMWRIHNLTTATQVVGGQGILGGSPATVGLGEGADDEVDMNSAWSNRSLAVDTTIEQILALTWAHGVNDALISVRHNSSTLELV